MSGRSLYSNIPTDIIRTIVAVAETGSLSKAAERLGLSQPAISSQMKRIQGLLGGELFMRTPNGSTPTPLGKLALKQARKIIEANDQMLRLGGTINGPRPVRLGISTMFLQHLFQHESAESLHEIVIHSDNSLGIAKSLIDGLIDVACFLENSEIASDIEDLVVNQREEPFVWVRSKDFVLSPGKPLPLLTWPGDDIMIGALTRAAIAYAIVFTSPDFYARIPALEGGLGLAALPLRTVPASLVHAKEYYLPELPPVNLLLCAHKDVTIQSTPLLRRLSGLFFDEAY